MSPVSNVKILSLDVLAQTACLGSEADFLSCHIGLGLAHFCQLPSNGVGHIGKVEVGPSWQEAASTDVDWRLA